MKQSIDANFSKNKCKLQLALITHQRTLHKNNAFILLQQSCKKAAFSIWSVYGAKQGKLEIVQFRALAHHQLILTRSKIIQVLEYYKGTSSIAQLNHTGLEHSGISNIPSTHQLGLTRSEI